MTKNCNSDGHFEVSPQDKGGDQLSSQAAAPPGSQASTQMGPADADTTAMALYSDSQK